MDMGIGASCFTRWMFSPAFRQVVARRKREGDQKKKGRCFHRPFSYDLPLTRFA